ESGLRPSRGSALAPSTPGWLGHNRGEPLIVLDYITVNILWTGPIELLTCPAVRARSPISLPAASHPPPGPPATPGCRWPPLLPRDADRRMLWPPQARRAICAAPRRGCPALPDHQRAAGNIGQRWERLGGSDGGGDGDG